MLDAYAALPNAAEIAKWEQNYLETERQKRDEQRSRRTYELPPSSSESEGEEEYQPQIKPEPKQEEILVSQTNENVSKEAFEKTQSDEPKPEAKESLEEQKTEK